MFERSNGYVLHVIEKIVMRKIGRVVKLNGRASNLKVQGSEFETQTILLMLQCMLLRVINLLLLHD